MASEIDDLKVRVRDAENQARTAQSALSEEKGRRWKRMGMGAAVAALVLVVGGQFYPGYMLDATAERMAAGQTEAALKIVAVKILAPLCAAQAQADPDATKLAAITAITSAYQRNAQVIEAGWATSELELSVGNERALATECVRLLSEQNPI